MIDFQTYNDVYWIDDAGNKYLDFTSGYLKFPMGFSHVDLDDKTLLSTKKDIDILKKRLQIIMEKHNYNIYFFSNIYSAFNQLINRLKLFKYHIINSINIPFIPHYNHFFSPLICKNCPDDCIICNTHCYLFFKQFISKIRAGKIAFIGSNFLLDSTLTEYPLPFFEKLSEKNNILNIMYESNIATLGRKGSFLAIDNLNPDIIIGGENLANGFDFAYIAIRDNFLFPMDEEILRNEIIKNALYSLKRYDHGLINENIEVMSSFFNKLNNHYSIGLIGVILLKNRGILKKFLQKCKHYGVLILEGIENNLAIIAPPLNIKTDELKQGLNIIKGILKSI